MKLFIGSTLLMVIFKVLQMCIWFGIGVIIYSDILKGKLGIKIQGRMLPTINKLSFIELTLIIFTLFYFINFIFTLSFNYFFNLEQLNYDSRLFIIGENIGGSELENTKTDGITSSSNIEQTNSISKTQIETNNTSTTVEKKVTNSYSTLENTTNSNKDNNKVEDISRKVGKSIKYGGEAIIMSATVSGGIKLAQYSPTLAGKVGFTLLGVAVGGTAIIASKFSSKISEDILNINSNKYIDLIEPIKDALHLTGNNGIDSLLLIQNFQKMQLILLFMLGYNLLILYINEKKLEEVLLKIMEVKIVNFIINIFKKFKKSVKVFLFCSFILLVISNLQAYHYLDFYINNIEDIIKLYFK